MKTKSRGFALIATVSVMILVALVMVAFLSLSAVSMQTSRTEWAEEEARANARLALMIAIGELQRDLGPDRRISASAAIMDENPDTLDIDGVAQPHWLVFGEAGLGGEGNDSPFSRDEEAGGLSDERGGTNFRFRDWVKGTLVSGNEGGPTKSRGGRKYLDALVDSLTEGPTTMTLVGDGSVAYPEDRVVVPKVATEKLVRKQDGTVAYEPTGGYAWWVTSNSQKAHVGRMDRHQEEVLSESGDGIQRMIHAQDVDISVVDGLSLGVLTKDRRVLTPKTLALLDEGNREGVKENFHALASWSAAVLENVRDGGLKKSLTSFLNSGEDDAPEIEDLDSSLPYYIGLSGADRLVGPPNDRWAELRGEDYAGSKLKEGSPTFGLIWNWARMAGEFEFGNARTGIRIPEIWSNAPFMGGGTNVYDGENDKPVDPRRLSTVKMTPVIVEAAMYYNLATYPEGEGDDRKYVLRKCLYPRVGLWNPYNAELRLDKPMILQLFLNGKKSVEFDGDANFTREVYYGGRRDSFDGQYGGQVYFTLPAVTIPPGETFIFSMGGAPREFDINDFGRNQLQANTPPSSASYLYKDYRIENLTGSRANFARDDDDEDSEFMPKAPTKFRERPLDFKQHGADNYMFMLKYLESGLPPSRATFPYEPMLIYASISLQAGGGDEYPLSWNDGNTAPVHQLNGREDHLPDGLEPHPYTRDGFRVRWLEETESNKGPGGINAQYLQSSALGNWNLRAAYITRTPFDNVTSQAPYFHGIYTRDNPSDELSWGALTPVERNGYQTGFPFGPAGFGVDSVVAFEVPTAEVGIPSLGYLRHLQLSEYVWHPSYSIGSSLADPRIETTGTMPAREMGSSHGWNASGFGTAYWAQLFRNIVFEMVEDQELVFDMSYEVNHNLWSDYFLMGATENQILRFADDPIGNPLDNGNLFLWDRSGRPGEDLTDFYRAAGRLLVEGGFDVHSTNKEAWKALLSSTRDVGYGSLERSPFPRTLHPKGEENDKAEYSQKFFTGFRSLSDQEIDSLAEAIVREVKIRAPFFGMADFVNRRLSDDETGRRGLLESALENSLPNRGMDGRFPIDRSALPDQGPLIAEGNPSQATTTPMFQESLPASTGYGVPGYITQGDVLQVIGSTLTARSDTFKIRAYGESKNGRGEVVARAWCEAVVQRTPEPVVPDAITGMNPRIPLESEVDFGRRFRVVSFRWLNRDEV